MAKTPAERAREYRARKKLLTPQKPPPQTRAQHNQKYTARQKALKNAVAIGENEAMTDFSGSYELPTVNLDNPQSSTSRDDNNILYNYLSQTNVQPGQAQVPVENLQEIKVVQADVHQANLSQCAVNPLTSTTTKITRKSCAQRYRQRLKRMAKANAIVVQRPVASPIMNVLSNVNDIQVDPAKVLQPETIVIECDLTAASVVRQGNYG